jgi:hypothetical protein
MKPPTIYLAGPINGCNDDEANGWRDKFMHRLPRCGFLDPMVRDYRGREDECVQEIVEGDKADIGESDVFLAYCWQSSWGTAMEILHAYNLFRFQPKRLHSVVLVIPEGTRISPWQRYHSDVIVPTLELAAQWIEGEYCSA